MNHVRDNIRAFGDQKNNNNRVMTSSCIYITYYPRILNDSHVHIFQITRSVADIYSICISQTYLWFRDFPFCETKKKGKKQLHRTPRIPILPSTTSIGSKI